MTVPRLKVLYLLASLPVGGAEDLVRAMVTGLDPDRFAAGAACLGAAGLIGEELIKAGYSVHSLGLDLKHTPFLSIVARVRRLLNEVRPDILHTHLYHANLYGRLAALGLGLTGVVATVHNIYTRPKLHRRVWNRLLAWASDCVVTVSPQVYRDVRRADWLPASRVVLLPNGISLAGLEVPEDRDQARARLGLSGFVLGVVGRLEEQKGHTYLLQALPRLMADIPDLNLAIVGDGRLKGALEGQARELGPKAAVCFMGMRRDVPLILRALDLYVMPSLWEGLPLALLQAMGAGLPVAATRVGGVEEVIRSGENGLLVPPADPQALAEAILELYHDPARREEMGRRARQTVAESYSQEVMLRRLEDLYLELWAKRGGGGSKI
jgi:glycosyltransferase involved in cell wall biosynthesis